MISKLRSRTTGDQTLTAGWKSDSVNTFTNHISLWANGFVHGEGTNKDKNSYYLGDSIITKRKGETFAFSQSFNTVAVPNGFALNTRKWGSHYFTEDDTWEWYSFDDSVKQPAKDTWNEYSCDPVQYKIIYNLNGGTNNEDNPSTYNVLYGVTLKDPKKEGYLFNGWMNKSGKKVTGINEGVNASFKTVDELMNQLRSRTTGDQELTASWKEDPDAPLKVLQQPKNVKASEGEKVSVFIVASGSGKTYRWQWSTDGKKWNNCTGKGYNTDKFSFLMQEKYDGRKYRCIVSCGEEKVVSEVAEVSLVEELRIIHEPEDIEAVTGETVGLHLEASGKNLAYRWQWSTDGKKWNNCTGTGYDTDTFSFVMQKKYDGRRYRCTVSSGEAKVVSEVAQVSIIENLEIIREPEDIEASIGETVELNIEASGENLSYQWQWSTDGKKWNNCTGTGYDTDTFSFVMQKKYDGRRYRCTVSSGEAKVVSEAAQVSIIENLEIIREPEDVEASIGETVELNIEASGKNLSYQWQWSVDGKKWNNCTGKGYNTDTFSFVMQTKYDGRRYRCIISNREEEIISEQAAVNIPAETSEILEVEDTNYLDIEIEDVTSEKKTEIVEDSADTSEVEMEANLNNADESGEGSVEMNSLDIDSEDSDKEETVEIIEDEDLELQNDDNNNKSIDEDTNKEYIID